VQLQQVDVVDTEPVEGAADLVVRAHAIAPAGLRGQEESVAMLREEGRKSQLGIAVRRGGVDVVYAVLEEQPERAVRLRLGH